MFRTTCLMPLPTRLRTARGLILAWLVGLALIASTAGVARSADRDQVVAAGQQLSASLTRLDDYLRRQGERRAGWRRYLLLDDLEAQLRADASPEMPLLARAWERFHSGQSGLDLPPFFDTARRLTDYIDARVAADPDDTLGSWIASSAGDYRAATPTEIESARMRLWQALDALDRNLKANLTERSAWKRYLGWNALVPHVQQGMVPDETALSPVLERYRSGAAGLEWQPILATRQALAEFTDLSHAATNPDAATQFAEQLAVLKSQVALPADGQDLTRVAAALAWLDRHRQCPALVAAARRWFSRPNLVVRVSGDFIARVASRPIDDVAPVRDRILGTEIYGTGRTVGAVSMQLVDHPSAAVLEAVLRGTNYSTSRGYNGPAIIYSRGRTELEGRVRIFVTDEQISTSPPRAKAHVSTQITGTGSTRRGLLGHVVSKVAARRAPQQKSQGERIAEQHAAERLEDRFRDEFAARIGQANARLQQRLRAPLLRHDRYPRLLQFSTEANALWVRAIEEAAERLAAATAPPPIEGTPAVAFLLHESLVNNVGLKWLAGRRVPLNEVRAELEQMLGRPLRTDTDEPPPEVAITFDATRPLTMDISDGRIAVTVHGRRYEVEGRGDIENWDVTARYQLVDSPAGLLAQRDGALEIRPAGFTPGRRLGLRESLTRNTLSRVLTPRFPESFDLGHIEFEGELAAHGPLTARQWQADGGWLLLGWDR